MVVHFGNFITNNIIKIEIWNNNMSVAFKKKGFYYDYRFYLH